MENIYTTIKYPQVWKPSLFMFLTLALSYSTHEGHFYWYTDPKVGPAFSKVCFSSLISLKKTLSFILLCNLLNSLNAQTKIVKFRLGLLRIQ